jgi:hypothetical protein
MTLRRRTARYRADGRFRSTPWRLEHLETRDLLTLLINPNLAPVAGTALPSDQVIATFDVGDIVGTSFSASVTWGDSQIATPATTVVQQGNEFLVEASHLYNFATSPSQPYDLSVTVTNSADTASASASGTVSVTPAPVVISTIPVMTSKGAIFSGFVASFTDQNPGAATGFVSASINWGDGTAPTVGMINVINSSTFEFSVTGSHVYASSGSYPTTITINDLDQTGKLVVKSTPGFGAATVKASPAAITPISQLLNTPVNVAVPATAIVGSFTYTPPANATNPPVFTASINWGDGSSSTVPDPSSNIVEANNGVYNISGVTHDYTLAGTYPVIINIADNVGNSNTINSQAIVTGSSINAVGTTITVTPSAPFSGVVATFTDSNPDAATTSPTAVINWGDGSQTIGTVSGPNANGLFFVSGMHNYGSTNLAASYVVAVAITGPDGEKGTALSNAVVSRSVINPISQLLTTPAGSPLPAKTIIGAFTYLAPPGSPNPPVFSATINWGDGTVTEPPQVTFVQAANGVYDVEAPHTYAAPGNYTVTITVADTLGNTGTITSPAVVSGPLINAIGTNIAITPGVTFTGVVASFTDANPLAKTIPPTALIDWGNGTITTGTVSTPNASGVYTVTGTINYGMTNLASIYHISVGIFGPSGEISAPQSFARVTLPVFSPISQLVVASPDTPLPGNTVFGSFTYAPPAGFPTTPAFTTTINFGDGQTGPGMVVYSNGVANVESTHTYLTAGTYPVTVTVADPIGNTVSITSSASVGSVSPIVASGTTIAITPGVAFSGIVANFTDANPLAKTIKPTAVIVWGPGNETPGIVSFPGANGLFTVSASNYYGPINVTGTSTATVLITGPSGETGSATTTVVTPTFSPIKVIPTVFAVNPDAPFSGTVATFTDPNPSAMTTKPTVSIDWGNGTVSAGTVTGPDANGVFTVMGAIYYLTTSTTGSYPVTVTVTDASGATGTAMSTAEMNMPMATPTLSGGLDTAGENGPNAALGYSNTNRPTFSGTTSPFALVQLYAKRTDVDATLSLGQTVAGSNGSWSLGVGPLSQGIFAITAVVTAAGGSPTGPIPVVPAATVVAPPAGSQPIGPMPGGPSVGGSTGLYVIDTTPPAVVGVSADGPGKILVKFQDALSGMDLMSLGQTVNYTFAGSNGSSFHPTSASVLPGAGLPTDVESVVLKIPGGPKAMPKTLRITAAGIIDNAGNPLANNYHGGIAPASYLAKSNPVIKLKSHKPKPQKH